MKTVEISNWKELKEKCIDYRDDWSAGIDHAKLLSKKLREEYYKSGDRQIALNFNPEKTEVFALFESRFEDDNKIVFEYTGTAN